MAPVRIFSTSYSPPNTDVSGRSPIIFMPGLFATNRTWNPVKYEISDNTKRKVFAIDLRNHGESEWTDEFSIKLFVEDLEHFMRAENIPKAVLVGHSLGGRVALAFALKKPEMVEKLVIEDVSMIDTERSIQGAQKTVEFLKSTSKVLKFLPNTMTEVEAHKRFLGYLQSYFPEMAKNVSSSNISLTLPFYKDKSGKFTWELNVDALFKLVDNLDWLALDLSNDPVYHGEMLLLGAEKSELLRKDDLCVYHKHFPKFQSYFFEGGFHNLHLEFPKKFIQMVSNFIGK